MGGGGVESQVGRFVSYVLLFFVGDRTFTSRVLSPPLMKTVDGGRGRRKGTTTSWMPGTAAGLIKNVRNVMNVLRFV